MRRAEQGRAGGGHTGQGGRPAQKGHKSPAHSADSPREASSFAAFPLLIQESGLYKMGTGSGLQDPALDSDRCGLWFLAQLQSQSCAHTQAPTVLTPFPSLQIKVGRV